MSVHRPNVVYLDEARREPAKMAVAAFAQDGRVYLTLPDRRTVWMTPAQARFWSSCLATLADTAEAEGGHA